jgi:hypothetical protein
MMSREMHSPMKYVYLMGMEHSGSTLLAFLLNAHPEVVSIGETDVVDEILPERWASGQGQCSCGRPYVDCPFWNSVLAGLAARGHGLGHPVFFENGWRSRRAASSKRGAMVAALLDVAGKTVFLDASKDPDYVLPIVNDPQFDLRVLDLYRDGRGIVNSWRKNNPQATITWLTRQWLKREKRRMQVLKKLPPGRVFHLQYEALAQAPQDKLREAFAFIGVDPEVDATVGYKTRVEHHIIGNQMRLNTVETIVFDEKWRKQLTPPMLAEFEQAGGGKMNQQNGYPAA